MTGAFLTFLQFLDPVLPLLLTIMVHSTIVLGMALLVSLVMRLRGILGQVFVLRIFLVAVLAAPIIVLTGPLPGRVTLKIPELPGLFGSRQSGAFTETAHMPSWQNLFCENEYTPILPFSLKSNRKGNQHAVRENGPFLTATPKQPSTISPARFSPGFPSAQHQKYQGLRDIVVLIVLRGCVLLWIMLSGIAVWRLGAAHVYLYRMRRNAVPAGDATRVLCEQAAHKVGVVCPAVVISPQVASPILSGWIWPVILLPEDWDNAPEMHEQVVLHELFHLAQRDTFWNLIRELGTALYPLQPLMRLLSRRLEILSDYACDAFVMERLPENGTYINNLLALAGRHLEDKYGISLHAGFYLRGSLLRRRIRRLLTGREGELLPITCTRMAAITAVCAGTVVTTLSLAVEFERPSGTVSLQAVVAQTTHTVIAAGQTYAKQVVEKETDGTLENAHTPVGGETDRIEEVRDEKVAKMSTDIPVEPVSRIPRARRPTYASTTAILRTSDQGMGGQGRILETQDISGSEGMADGDDHGQNPMEIAAETDSSGLAYLLPLDSLTVVRTGEPEMLSGMALAAQPFEVKMPVAKEVNVIIDYDFDENAYDINDAEDRRQYSIFLGLDKKKNEPAWSPDGSQVAFTDYNRIWIVPVEGGRPKIVYENLCEGNPIGGVESIRFSPDGGEIIFKRFVYDESRGSTIQIIKRNGYENVMFNNPASNIESVDIATGETRLLVENGYSCDWSPDGSQIVYLGSPDGAPFQPGIDTKVVPMALDPLTGERRALTEQGSLRYGVPTFNHDGTVVIVAARVKNGPVNLYRIPVDSGEPECLTEYDPDAGHGKYRNYPECSPDGRWILYTDQSPVKTGPDQRLFLYEMATGEVTPFFEESEYPKSYGTWSPAGDRICYVESRDDGNYLYIATFDRYNAEKAAHGDEQPQYAFSLSQNYPNPFNAATTIEFSIPEDGRVDLCIYNILGQQVRTLLSDTLPAGSHSVRWDGRSSSGEDVGSGVYMAVLTSGGKRKIQRMTSLR